MKHLFKLFLFLFFGIFGFFVSTTFAQENFDPIAMPSLDKYVEDFSNSLNSTQLSELRELGYDYFSWTSTQIVAVVFPHRQWNELIDIWVKLFNENGIGQKGHDNGLLLLISSEEKKLRIIVWYGLEGAVPDATAKYIVESVRPYVNEWDFYNAIKSFYALSIQEIAIAWDVFKDDWESIGNYSYVSWGLGYSILHFILVLIWIVVGFRVPFRKKRQFPNAVKKFFKKIRSWWDKKKEKKWKSGMGIFLSYVLAIIILFSGINVIDSLPNLIQSGVWGFLPSFWLGFLFALIPPGTFKWGSGWGSYSSGSSYKSSSSSSSRSSSSSSSSYSSWGYSWWGGNTWGGWAGD